jgi:hypothetical protein
MLLQARAEQFSLSVITGSDTPQMREVFAETDTRLPPLEAARLGANASVFASPEVSGLYELLFAEAWPVELYPVRFRSDEARITLLGRTARILADLEAAICRELGTGHGGETPRRRAEDGAESAVNHAWAGSRQLLPEEAPGLDRPEAGPGVINHRQVRPNRCRPPWRSPLPRCLPSCTR